MRAATLVRLLQEREDDDWVLVLPPWPRLYHWKTPGGNHGYKPWHSFFDLASLNEFVPSIEFDDYLNRNGPVINEVGVVIYHNTRDYSITPCCCDTYSVT